ncbi:rRNA maturation RNase YbeY [Pseudobacteroides cellulosolvens]|uniref:Endoribonuclease YbeY n=1 Tax=Pseudobacteroides cellulosolvens ATCC 35603 = DSM 2933 TaxID=398512 RepID=A0A0L6JIS4_9FIRM|nr:rRNA maturation RNase YbeY [Pseudobacteroides cellulosolvens]KNY25741.1 metalloprotease ybeY [Pseudobacteroides cellulosolvens ATCC 35603 = DSM 2933]
MEIYIENIQDKIEVTPNLEKIINDAVKTSMEIEEFDIQSEVSILLVDDEKIREINNEHRHIDKATDVLSFPVVDMHEGEILSNEGDFDLDEDLLLLGDIIISLETAKSQAAEYGHSFEREIAFLTTHGVFHLLGYDHMEKEEEEKMLGKQELVLRKLGLVRNEK